MTKLSQATLSALDAETARWATEADAAQGPVARKRAWQTHWARRGAILSGASRGNACSGDSRAPRLTRAGGVAVIRGLAMPWYAISYEGTAFMPDAFAASLSGNIALLTDHDPRAVAARTGDGTLQLAETHVGLEFRAVLLDTDASRQIVEHLERNPGDGRMSITADATDFRHFAATSGCKMEVRRARLLEISVMVKHGPKFPGTSCLLSWERLD